MATATSETTSEQSFDERIKAARRAQLKVIRDAIDELSPEERKYLGFGDDRPVPARETETIVREMTLPPANRPAKRKHGKSDAAFARDHQASLKQQDAALRNMAREASQMQVKKQREKELQERQERRDKKQKDSYRAPGEFHIKAKEFVPVIGAPNAKGETPVQLDAKTTIYVAAGKNVQERINLWLKNLKR